MLGMDAMRWGGGGVRCLAELEPPRLELLDEDQFFTRVEAAVARHARTREGVGILRATVRDLGDDALRDAIRREDVPIEAACELDDGTFALLVIPGGAEALNRLAFALADATERNAGAAGLGAVQTITAAFASGRARVDALELLDGAEFAFHASLQQAFAMASGLPS